MNNIIKITFVLVLAVTSQSSMGQSGNPVIPPCYGDTVKRVLTVEMLTLFNQSGINLNDYKWDNNDINCYINSAVLNYTKYQANMKLGGYGLGMGIGFIPIGIVSRSALGSGTGWIVIGSACLVGGIYLISRALKQKKTHDSSIGAVGEYYRQNNIQ